MFFFTPHQFFYFSMVKHFLRQNMDSYCGIFLCFSIIIIINTTNNKYNKIINKYIKIINTNKKRKWSECTDAFCDTMLYLWHLLKQTADLWPLGWLHALGSVHLWWKEASEDCSQMAAEVTDEVQKRLWVTKSFTCAG